MSAPRFFNINSFHKCEVSFHVTVVDLLQRDPPHVSSAAEPTIVGSLQVGLTLAPAHLS